MNYYWCVCEDCEHIFIAQFVIEQGSMFAVDEYGEECSECGGNLEVRDVYDGVNDEGPGVE